MGAEHHEQARCVDPHRHVLYAEFAAQFCIARLGTDMYIYLDINRVELH